MGLFWSVENKKCSSFIILISISTSVTLLDVLSQTITLRCLIKGHARLFFSESLSSLTDFFHVITEKLSTLLTVFHVVNKKIGRPCSFIKNLILLACHKKSYLIFVEFLKYCVIFIYFQASLLAVSILYVEK